jgi:hypothetical protein
MNVTRMFIVELILVVSQQVQRQLHLFGGVGGSYYQGDMYGAVLPTLKTTCFSWKAGVGYDFHRR